LDKQHYWSPRMTNYLYQNMSKEELDKIVDKYFTLFEGFIRAGYSMPLSKRKSGFQELDGLTSEWLKLTKTDRYKAIKKEYYERLKLRNWHK